jgi:bifunctional DNA-binding transcriptional regulator/antitoxin component of YhaV-PrlF toxin-antitoxin module
MVIHTKLRRWGNSFGVVIPSETLREEDLKEGQEVIIEITRKKDMKKIFGSLRGWKIDSQKLKDEARKDWGD